MREVAAGIDPGAAISADLIGDRVRCAGGPSYFGAVGGNFGRLHICRRLDLGGFGRHLKRGLVADGKIDRASANNRADAKGILCPDRKLGNDASARFGFAFPGAVVYLEFVIEFSRRQVNR